MSTWSRCACVRACVRVSEWCWNPTKHPPHTPFFGTRTCTTQDLTLISADETNGVTTIVFSRPLLALDPLEDRTIIDDDVTLNWAVCPDDGVGLTFPKHNLAGTATVNFLAVDGEVRVGGDNYSAGFGVLMVSAAVFTLYVLIRWTKSASWVAYVAARRRRGRERCLRDTQTILPQAFLAGVLSTCRTPAVSGSGNEKRRSVAARGPS